MEINLYGTNPSPATHSTVWWIKTEHSGSFPELPFPKSASDSSSARLIWRACPKLAALFTLRFYLSSRYLSASWGETSHLSGWCLKSVRKGADTGSKWAGLFLWLYGEHSGRNSPWLPSGIHPQSREQDSILHSVCSDYSSWRKFLGCWQWTELMEGWWVGRGAETC